MIELLSSIVGLVLASIVIVVASIAYIMSRGLDDDIKRHNEIAQRELEGDHNE